MLKLGVFCITLVIMMHKEAWLQSISFRYDTFTPDPPGCDRAIIIIDTVIYLIQDRQRNGLWSVTVST